MIWEHMFLMVLAITASAAPSANSNITNNNNNNNKNSSTSSNNFLAQLFNRMDIDGDGLAGVSELKFEYARNQLPFTPGYEYLMTLVNTTHYQPLNETEWISL